MLEQTAQLTSVLSQDVVDESQKSWLSNKAQKITLCVPSMGSNDSNGNELQLPVSKDVCMNAKQDLVELGMMVQGTPIPAANVSGQLDGAIVYVLDCSES
jgi:hypothetical protein